MELTGKRFGNLVVISRSDVKVGYGYKWLCKCDCGNTKLINGYDLTTGHTKSCGCLVRKKCIERSTKHNLTHTSVYSIYNGMIRRCYDNKRKAYKWYGGRGIQVCEEWRHDVVNFYNWAISHGYKEGLTIDRINVDGNYEPANCRWVPLSEQSKNRRFNHRITIGNETHHIADWAKIMHVEPRLISVRISRGWNEQDAVLVPLNGRRP